MGDWSWLPVVFGGIATLAIYSFLIKENAFYRFFEHLYIGIATGFGIVLGIQRFLWPQLFRPMLGYDREVLANGTFDRPWREWYLIYLIPFAFGMLYYFIYSKKRQWLSRLVIAFSLGVAGGFALKGFFAQYMPQIISSFKPLVAVETVERDLLVRFQDIESKLPEDATITDGYMELYRLGPSRARLVLKKGASIEELEGDVLRADEKTIQVKLASGETRDCQREDIILKEDLPPLPGTEHAVEGFGGEHIYKAYRMLRPWKAGESNWDRRSVLDQAEQNALREALSKADPKERVGSAEAALNRKLALGETDEVLALDPKDPSSIENVSANLTARKGEHASAAAESGAGVPMLVRDDKTVRDIHRGDKWTASSREQVGWKKCDLSVDTLQNWLNLPEANFGVLLQRKDGVGGSLLHRFASSTNEETAIRPRLVINYTQPPAAAGEEPRKGQLILQRGTDGYEGVEETVLVQGQSTVDPPTAEFLLGASALTHDGKLSVNWLSPKGTIANWIFIITLICVMTYFLFSFEHSGPGIRHAATGGRWLMMICFGAFFGSTIMARMALLVERLQFLIREWLPTIFPFFFG